MNLNYHINHIIVQKIRLELVKHFQSDELDELKEQFKKEFIKINNTLINEKDLNILEKYKCFEYLETLKISKTNIYIYIYILIILVEYMILIKSILILKLK